MNNVKEKNHLIFLILLGFLVFFPFLGSVHLFDWDEANFAELSREMVLTKNYLQPQINYLPFYEKPPIFMWMQVICMQLFGINEFAARCPNALLGILVMISLYLIGKREKDSKFGLVWILTFVGSFLPFMYFRTGLIDPWFNFFMFLSLYFYYISTKPKENQDLKYQLLFLLFSSIFLGLAVQTKGPVALIIVWGSIGIYWLITKFKSFPGILYTGFWVITTLIFSSIWFVYEYYMHGSGYMSEFITYQIRLFTTEDALHGGPFYYHVLVLLLGCFPASIILLFHRNWKEKLRSDWFKIMCICGLLVLILFSIVQTKIIHYSSMAYYPISYIAATILYQNTIKYRVGLNRVLTFIILILIFVTIAMPILGNNLQIILPLIKDKQAQLQLGAHVDWHYGEAGYGIFILALFIYLRRKFVHNFYPYFFTTATIVLVLLIVFAPKIERYTQGTYIDFCKTKKGKDVYIQPLFLKSYANLFYSERMPFNNDTSRNHGWMYDGDIDKDVFFISVTKDSLLTRYPRPYIQILERKNGFDFMARKVSRIPLN